MSTLLRIASHKAIQITVLQLFINVVLQTIMVCGIASAALYRTVDA
ncbi:hypothetical protein LX69_03338 [Breznakibacter xylanolyticus]|uniref:Uncharacterized protein n=1 Tax=Breznakibacter xylanolyticus TaxID=990 RepID=A0A2W7N164_9BACT|nr:hypothetical protein LX69_03338 [Breznakibacter xylanolyticus]